MKRIVLAVILSAVAAVSLFAANPILEHARKTTHVTLQTTSLGNEHGKCSATAVGPHALLTASHCEIPNTNILIDGESVRIKGVLRDDKDHTIYLVDKTFKDYSLIANPASMAMGDHVFIIGNPGVWTSIYREGVIAGEDKGFVLIDMRAFPGDSGSAIFNEKGEIVGVVSVGAIQSDDLDHDGTKWVIVFVGALPLNFTASELLQAQTWKPGDAVPEHKQKKAVDTSVGF